ncbi:MAG TPA: RNA 2',3'-cyclic phosphodiesterase [Arenicellales bacterium]|nr:RNA 2',3'-cyclic phosphodiesterase [Arenicellales bacterium]
MGGTGRSAERYFFAVWPDDAVRERLAAWSDAIRTRPPARRVAAGNLHITLAFVGTLEPEGVDAVREAASAIRWQGATLRLDRIGWWKRSDIIWAGSSEGPASLAALAGELRARLQRLGFRMDSRPFVPHVTLYRNARRRPRWQRQVIEWRIDEFLLVKSTLSPEGPRYDRVDHWCAPGDVE